MKLFIIVHKRNGKKVAVVENTFTEACKLLRWLPKSVILADTHIIDNVLVNPDIWKQPKPTTPNRIKVK